jgi:hypothetical protein
MDFKNLGKNLSYGIPRPPANDDVAVAWMPFPATPS